MDQNLTTAGLSAGSVAILAMIWRGLHNVNHRRLVSRCCGRKIEMSVDVGESSLTPEESRNRPPPLSLKSSDIVVDTPFEPVPKHPSNPSVLRIDSKRGTAPSQQSVVDTSVRAPIVPTISVTIASDSGQDLPQQVAER